MTAPLTRRAALTAFGSAFLCLPAVHGARAALPANAEAKLAKFFEAFRSKQKIPGLQIAMARKGEILFSRGFGSADTNNSNAVTPMSLFRLASVSKPITSVALHRLFEQKKLSPSDKVFGAGGILGKRFGSKDYDPNLLAITVNHLLTHTSGGWTNDADDPMFLDPALNLPSLISYTLDNIPLKTKPGKAYAYSNFGYCLLGRVIEAVTGENYESFVKRDILASCGISRMRIARNSQNEKAPREVTYYDPAYPGVPYRLNVRRMDSHGGWIGSAEDAVKFALHVDGSKTVPDVLTSSSIKAMTRPTAANPNYARGWGVHANGNWWHSGSLSGTTTVLVKTGGGLCWAAFANTRSPKLDSKIDSMMWDAAAIAPGWL